MSYLNLIVSLLNITASIFVLIASKSVRKREKLASEFEVSVIKATYANQAYWESLTEDQREAIRQ